MKKIAIIAMMALAGCATQAPQVSAVQACAAYNAAINSAITLREQGKLSPAQIAEITNIDAAASPICTGPMPTTTSQQVATVVNAAAIITTMKGAQK